METRDLIKILTVLYFGLVICLFGSFQAMKITDNEVVNFIKKILTLISEFIKVFF